MLLHVHMHLSPVSQVGGVHACIYLYLPQYRQWVVYTGNQLCNNLASRRKGCATLAAAYLGFLAATGVDSMHSIQSMTAEPKRHTVPAEGLEPAAQMSE